MPLIGALAWGWDAFLLLMLYWMQSAIIPFWTIARIATLFILAVLKTIIDVGLHVAAEVRPRAAAAPVATAS